MPLLGRGGLVVDQDLVDDRLDRTQEWSESIPGRRKGIRLGLLEDLADRVSRMLEIARDLADGLAIAPRPPNGTVVVHRKHVLDPPWVNHSMWEGSPYRRWLRWVSFTRPFCPQVGQFYAPISNGSSRHGRFGLTISGGEASRERCDPWSNPADAQSGFLDDRQDTAVNLVGSTPVSPFAVNASISRADGWMAPISIQKLEHCY